MAHKKIKNTDNKMNFLYKATFLWNKSKLNQRSICTEEFYLMVNKAMIQSLLAIVSLFLFQGFL